jgi:pSer/pThr/pTyr-binding forkhead associated (FHA) protein
MEAPVNLPPAEVVVVAGRLCGTRRPLAGPLTLFGRAPSCDVRLNVEDVQPLHAALVHGPEGFLLRDLAGQGSVLVNDELVSLSCLKHGDVFRVGPFQFRLEAADPSGEKAAEAERDALRVQAAAVAAQQAALTEEEVRLTQRRSALDEQESQLAGRLEERRRRLLELQEQTRQDRAALQAACAAAEHEQAALGKELQEARNDAAAEGKKARAERERLAQLHKRLQLRSQRHWDGKEAVLARREKELAAREAKLEHDAQGLQSARHAFTAERLRFNGEVELGKRQLREECQDLALAQQQWEACLNEEHAGRERRARELDARAAAVDEAEQAWAGRERSARLMLVDLHRESAGLEARIKNQREQLAQEEGKRGTGEEGKRGKREEETTLPSAPLPVRPSAPLRPSKEAEDQTAALGRVADSLADQRAHLLEQWRTLLRVQEEWRREREEALADLEAAGRSLQEREQGIETQERRLGAEAAEQRQRQQSLSQMRYSLEGWQARVKARDAAWAGERATLLAETRAREEAAGLQLKRIQDLARRRDVQRAKEAEELAAARARCEDLRLQYVALWEECSQRREELAREHRDLAARTLAAEQLRLEVVGKAPHAARAERRLERLRRRNAARSDSAEREVTVARRSLAVEAGRLDVLAQHLKRQQDELAARRERLAREQAAWEERRAAAEDAADRGRLELKRLTARREQDERVIAQLGDEVERVAALLIAQAEAPAAQAA